MRGGKRRGLVAYPHHERRIMMPMVEVDGDLIEHTRHAHSVVELLKARLVIIQIITMVIYRNESSRSQGSQDLNKHGERVSEYHNTLKFH